MLDQNEMIMLRDADGFFTVRTMHEIVKNSMTDKAFAISDDIRMTENAISCHAESSQPTSMYRINMPYGRSIVVSDNCSVYCRKKKGLIEKPVGECESGDVIVCADMNKIGREAFIYFYNGEIISDKLAFDIGYQIASRTDANARIPDEILNFKRYDQGEFLRGFLYKRGTGLVVSYKTQSQAMIGTLSLLLDSMSIYHEIRDDGVKIDFDRKYDYRIWINNVVYGSLILNVEKLDDTYQHAYGLKLSQYDRFVASYGVLVRTC